MSAYRALAPAKVNLGLFLGPPRAADGRHELVTVMQSISLADELRLESAASAGDADDANGAHGAKGADGADEVLCPGLPGAGEDNLAARALAAFRAATGWSAPPQRLTIAKRIPVAAGLGGGSADAAGALRLARLASGLGDETLLRELGASLGADVPAQIAPGRWLASGAGELLEPLPDPLPALELLVLASHAQLPTAEVYAEADRLGLGRDSRELDRRREQLRAALELGAPLPAARELLHNDLQQAAISLYEPIARALAELADAGADELLVSGSGPTALALFGHANPSGRAQRAAASLAGHAPAPIRARSVDASFAQAERVA
jgi:4-diphosphocytidyl-2-C-methyl-D-erythritol kinase